MHVLCNMKTMASFLSYFALPNTTMCLDGMALYFSAFSSVSEREIERESEKRETQRAKSTAQKPYALHLKMCSNVFR